jgi:hypothetical protein
MRQMIRHTISIRIAATLLAPIASLAMEKPDPAYLELWKRTGPLKEVTHGVPLVIGLLEAVEGLHVKSLFRADGSRFVPSAIQESNCYLDRILPSELRTALIECARSAVSENQRADPSALFEAIDDATDRRLAELYHNDRDGLGTFLGFLVRDYDIQGIRRSTPSPLERAAYSRGVYTDRNIPTCVSSSQPCSACGRARVSRSSGRRRR